MTIGNGLRLSSARLVSVMLVMAAGSAMAAPPRPFAEVVEDNTPLDVVYWPTPQPVVDAMLDLAQPTSKDTVFDLGCGDARSLVTAAKRYGARGFGFDLNPRRVRESIANVRKNRVENLVEIRQADILTVDLSKADVVFLYLVPSLMTKLAAHLDKLKPGARIVTHEFDFKGIKPVGSIRVIAPPDGPPDRTPEPGNAIHPLFLYVAPIQREANGDARN
jgi:SAM-dependent methyltransferase